MGRLSRSKGRSFEQRIAQQLRTAFPSATVRRSLQAHKAYEPDIVIEGDAPEIATRLWLELTDGRAPNPMAKLQQAERDTGRSGACPGWLPVVVWHRMRERSVTATMRYATMAAILGVSPGDADTAALEVNCDWSELLNILTRPRKEAA